MLGCCVECRQCTALKWICPLRFSISSCRHLIILVFKPVLLSLVLPSLSPCPAVDLCLNDAKSKQAMAGCHWEMCGPIKKQKELLLFSPSPRNISQWEREQCRHFSLLEMQRCVQPQSDSLSRSEDSAAWRRMRVFCYSNCVFFTPAPLVSYLDVMTAVLHLSNESVALMWDLDSALAANFVSFL